MRAPGVLAETIPPCDEWDVSIDTNWPIIMTQGRYAHTDTERRSERQMQREGGEEKGEIYLIHRDRHRGETGRFTAVGISHVFTALS